MEMTTKVCSRCKEAKPVTEFYLRNRVTGALASRCKPCNAAEALASARRRRELGPRQPATEKRCTWCGETKPLEMFSPKKYGDKLGYRSQCKACRPKAIAASRSEKPAQRREQDAAYRERHAAELAERQRRWREEHPSEYLAIHTGWKRRNPDLVNASTHRRRSTFNGAGSFTAGEWAALKEKYDHRCLSCRRQEPDIALTVDHIQPLSQGGLNTIDNIQPLCKSCNSRKHRGIVDFRTVWKGI